MTPTIDTDYLETVSARGLKIDLEPDFDKHRETSHYDDNQKRRLTRQLENLGRVERAGRVYVNFYLHSNCRIHSRPSVLTLPASYLWGEGTSHLDVAIPLEAVLFCRLQEVEELAQAYLANPGEPSGRILIPFFPELEPSKPNQQLLKLGFFGGLYGKRAEDEEERRVQDLIFAKWPDLRPPSDKDSRAHLRRKVFLMTSRISVAIGKAADEIEHAQTVGFFHGEPIVEYEPIKGEPSKAEVEAKLTALTYDLLRFWDPNAA